MKISIACLQILEQLTALVHEIDEKDFTKPSVALSGATIGQHIRHTLEFFICLEQGFINGSINYDRRAHDERMENDKAIALDAILKTSRFIETFNSGMLLKLEVGYDLQNDEFITVETNALRELVYNIEHAVHHMAIIKIGIREVAPYIKLPNHFGIAASTLRYKESTPAASFR